MVTAATLLRRIETLERGPEVQDVILSITRLKPLVGHLKILKRGKSHTHMGRCIL